MISKSRRQLVSMATLGGGLSLMGFNLFAQTSRRIERATAIVGYVAGNLTDTVARVFAEKIKGNYAAVVNVDNKPGAAGRIATAFMKGLPADGRNMLFTPGTSIVLAPHIFKTLPYDPLTDLTPVTRVVVTINCISVGPAVPQSVKTLAQFLDWCKANPNRASYGTSGLGGAFHLIGANLARLSGVPLTMVPYKGGGQAATDMVAGQVPAIVSTVPSVIEYARAGKARFLAVSSPQRLPDLPDVPTFAESGFPQLTGLSWLGVFLPANAPGDLVQLLYAALRKAAQFPDVATIFGRLGIDLSLSNSSEEFAREIRAEHEYWAGMVKAVGFRPQD